MYTEYEIRQLPLSIARYKAMVEAFLADNGLRLDAVDYYAGVFRIDWQAAVWTAMSSSALLLATVCATKA